MRGNGALQPLDESYRDFLTTGLGFAKWLWSGASRRRSCPVFMHEGMQAGSDPRGGPPFGQPKCELLILEADEAVLGIGMMTWSGKCFRINAP